MADVLIRGMEMPTNCGECAFLRRLEKPILYISPFWCCINGLEVIKQEKNRYCPLVPIPEGHGRLGDLDALQDEFKKFHDGKRSMLIDTAPTIVPAEGGNADG